MMGLNKKWLWSGIALLALLFPMLALGQAAITWWSIDGGGEVLSTGGTWELSGTLGQPDSTEGTVLIGGAWQLTGGFWAFGAADSDILYVGDFEN